jgi:hypothetical protein
VEGAQKASRNPGGITNLEENAKKSRKALTNLWDHVVSPSASEKRRLRKLKMSGKSHLDLVGTETGSFK